MLDSNLYHRDLYWLSYFDEQSLGLIKSAKRLSTHLWRYLDKSKNKRRNIDLAKLYLIVKSINLDNCKPFEVEVENDKVVKCAIRLPYNDKCDISIVFRDGFIVTSYLNCCQDKHESLNKSRYKKG